MPKMKEQAVYQITVTERQLKLINAALEEFFRIGLNQWGDLAERVANIGFEYPPKDMPNSRHRVISSANRICQFPRRTGSTSAAGISSMSNITRFINAESQSERTIKALRYL